MSNAQDTKENTQSIKELTKEVQNLRLDIADTRSEIRLLRQEVESMRDGQLKTLEEKVKFLQTVIFSGAGLIITTVLGAIVAGVLK